MGLHCEASSREQIWVSAPEHWHNQSAVCQRGLPLSLGGYSWNSVLEYVFQSFDFVRPIWVPKPVNENSSRLLAPSSQSMNPSSQFWIHFGHFLNWGVHAHFLKVQHVSNKMNLCWLLGPNHLFRKYRILFLEF